MTTDLPSAEIFEDAPGLAPRKGAIQEVSEACDRFFHRRGMRTQSHAETITQQCKQQTAKGIAEGKYEDHSEKKKTSHPAETGQAAEITAKRDRLQRRGEEEDKNITDRNITAEMEEKK